MVNSQQPRTCLSGALSRIALAVFATVMFLDYLMRGGWPPEWLDRRHERQIVIERLQPVGGWAALQRDCDTLALQYRDGDFIWFPRIDTNTISPDLAGISYTNALPPAISALKPRNVTFNSPAARQRDAAMRHDFRTLNGEAQFAVFRFWIFGKPNTDGHVMPYLGLEVVSGTNADGYTPHPSMGGAKGNRYDTYRKITNGIYEIY